MWLLCKVLTVAMSPPHGGADRNDVELGVDLPMLGRPLTGARIETTAGRPR